MGNCDSSIERRHIKNLSINNDYSNNFSSPSLPSISSSSKIIQKNNKRSNSTEKIFPSKSKEYILSENIAKREDISQKYKLSKQVLGDGATSIVYVGEEISSKKKFAIKRIIKEKILTKQNNVIKESEICLKLKNKNIVNYPFTLAIQDAFRSFNSNCQKIKNEPKINKLIAQQKNEIHDLIRKNANLTWANDQKLKSFTKAICEKVSSFEEKVSELINKDTFRIIKFIRFIFF